MEDQPQAQPAVSPLSVDQPTPSTRAALARRVLHGTIYLGIAQYSVIALGIIKTPILARLVSPDYFGIVTIAGAWVSFLNVLRVELRGVVISDPARSAVRLTIQYVFEAVAALSGMVITAVLYWLLPGMTSRLIWQAIFALQGLQLITALTSSPLYILHRDIRQRELMWLTLIGTLIALGLSVAAAFLGYPLLALLLDAMIPPLALGIGAWLVTGWRPVVAWDGVIARDVLSFGVTTWINGLLGKVTFQLGDWLVGNLRNTAELGFYSKAGSLAKLPMDVFAGIIGGIALPMYAESRAVSREMLFRVYELSTWLLVRIIALSTAVLLAAGEEIVFILLGPNWPAVPWLVRLMALYMLCRPLYQNNAQLLIAVRREKQVRTCMIVQSVILVLLGPPAVYFWGAEGASVAVSLMMVIGYLLSHRYVSHFLEMRGYALFLLPIVLTSLLTPLLIGVGSLIHGGVVVTLLAKGVLATAVFGAAIGLLERQRTIEVLALVLDSFRAARHNRPHVSD